MNRRFFMGALLGVGLFPKSLFAEKPPWPEIGYSQTTYQFLGYWTQYYSDSHDLVLMDQHDEIIPSRDFSPRENEMWWTNEPALGEGPLHRILIFRDGQWWGLKWKYYRLHHL